ncbi:class II aldolase/adducin family protein [Erwinia piriflorinigrans]|uniref:class II aldolase/adducin family protein n=1 Tax=Erwinia piriflorinigrans TaxID=665097 RepID=UPI000660E0A4|nr:class II aldolase/adducin family protein [Erwinia piriflorinigrans]
MSHITGASASLSGQALQRKQLALASRILSLNGHDDFNQGQVSSRLKGSDSLIIKRAMSGFMCAEPTDMIACAVDPDCRAPAEAPPELPLHQAIYLARPDVGAIVHTHPEHALVFGATEYEIEAISHEGSFFSSTIPRFTESSQTILNYEMGIQVAKCLGKSSALFLCNHGIVLAAKTIRQATVLAVMLERACRIQLLAKCSTDHYRTSWHYELSDKKAYIYSDVAMKSYWDTSVANLYHQFPEIKEWN